MSDNWADLLLLIKFCFREKKKEEKDRKKKSPEIMLHQKDPPE